MLNNFIFSVGGRNEQESVNMEGEAYAASLMRGRQVSWQSCSWERSSSAGPHGEEEGCGCS